MREGEGSAVTDASKRLHNSAVIRFDNCAMTPGTYETLCDAIIGEGKRVWVSYVSVPTSRG
jgi:hypothetical protein